MNLQTFVKLIWTLPLYQKLAASLSGVALAVMIYGLASLFSSSQSGAVSSDEPLATPLSLGHVTVNVTGAVTQPGIYTLMTGDRVAQAIEAAGGLSSEADQSQISQSFNLAESLIDGEKLEVPRLKSAAEVASASASATANSISLNKATLDELESLPGIGPTRAQAIIDHRPYTTINEVVSKGILGQAVWAQIKDKVGY